MGRIWREIQVVRTAHGIELRSVVGHEGDLPYPFDDGLRLADVISEADMKTLEEKVGESARAVLEWVSGEDGTLRLAWLPGDEASSSRRARGGS